MHDEVVSQSSFPPDPCRHGEPDPARCPVCKVSPPVERVIVYYTDGGVSFHKTPKCEALEEGQKIVDERGGMRSPVRDGYRDVVEFERRSCRTCW